MQLEYNQYFNGHKDNMNIKENSQKMSTLLPNRNKISYQIALKFVVHSFIHGPIANTGPLECTFLAT